ncbi:MAG TPA: glycogen debranching protein GlgX [Polyangiaceae bacterium]|nr:glycogen debranching protein GlgX [Polyangiaceae bacterium]
MTITTNERYHVGNQRMLATFCPEASAPSVGSGMSAPLGASIVPGGVNFSVFSRNASAVELLLFESERSPRPSAVISLDKARHRSYHYWHAFVPGLAVGQVYGYRAHGSFTPERGLLFDPEKLLLDPYGLAVSVPEGYDRKAASRPGDNTAVAMKSVVADPHRYDWEEDRPLKRPFAQTIIYELHVNGFTRCPSSGVVPERRGTYSGLIEKIPHLQDLGITAVELLPVFQFDAQDAPEGRVNYWGYQPVSFFAPHHAYSSRRDALGVLDEFRDMVKALHRAGIEVILDVVFNHTTEGGQNGPTLSYRGLANEFYYILEDGGARYADYTGCGNTLNANQPIVRRLIQDSLRYWVTEMHVDGFRFDLASILARDETGNPLANPPVLWDIESDPVLAGTKLIAEAWDAAGLYQVGSFVGDTWQEWNGRFRDDVRRFWKGDSGLVSRIATRFLGSPDLYGHEEREAEQSVNFVSCHDGFTLEDLVSYNDKHNEDNGEGNRDGANDNHSWNCGVEGPSADPEIESLRNRQVKNFLAFLLLSVGTPMILMGDEVRRTQRGNNNAYCQDSEISWLDWRLLTSHGDVYRFVKELSAFRQRRDATQDGMQMSLNELLKHAEIRWHGVTLDCPDWSEHSHSLAFTLRSLKGRFLFHVMLNAYWQKLTFELPPADAEGGGPWRRCIDTALPAPDDICRWDRGVPLTKASYEVEAHSLVLIARHLGSGDFSEHHARR